MEIASSTDSMGTSARSLELLREEPAGTRSPTLAETSDSGDCRVEVVPWLLVVLVVLILVVVVGAIGDLEFVVAVVGEREK